MFEVNDISPLNRARIQPGDAEFRCIKDTCPHFDICGGKWIYDDSRFCDNDCQNCIETCCKRDTGFKIAENLGGLEFDDIKWEKTDFKTARFAWTVSGKVANLEQPMYLIPVDCLVDRRTGMWAGTMSLHDRYSIPDTSQIGITFSFKDWLLEYLKRHEDDVYQELRKYDVDFVLPINYSVWRNYPRLDQLIQMRKKMLSMKRLQDVGIKTIPDVAVTRDIDVNRYADWLLENDCNIVYCTIQGVKKRNDDEWRRVMDVSVQLKEKISNLHVLMAGIGTKNMANALSIFGDDLTIVNASCWVFAELRIHILTREHMRKRGMSIQDVFKFNVETLQEYINALTNAPQK